MKKIGGYIAVFGLLSIVLPFFNLQLRFLGWLDNWGETTGYAIKISLIIVGAALFFMGNKDEEELTNN